MESLISYIKYKYRESKENKRTEREKETTKEKESEPKRKRENQKERREREPKRNEIEAERSEYSFYVEQTYSQAKKKLARPISQKSRYQGGLRGSQSPCHPKAPSSLAC